MNVCLLQNRSATMLTCLVLNLLDFPTPNTMHAWDAANDIHALIIAGPGENGCPGIHHSTVAASPSKFTVIVQNVLLWVEGYLSDIRTGFRKGSNTNGRTTAMGMAKRMNYLSGTRPKYNK